LPLWEALLGALLLCAALALWGRLPFPGAVALFITSGYGAGRFALEGLREERGPRFAGLDAYRWRSAALFVIGVAGLSIGQAALLAPPSWEAAGANDSQGVLHLVASALLLLPIVHLFRFLGCELIFTLKDPAPVHILQLLVIVPDLGNGPFSVTMQFLREPEMTEIAASPVELAPAGTEADGRQRFEALPELSEREYTVNCTVSRAGAITRTGTCSGELNGPGLVVAFNAENGSAAAALQPRLCFQPI
jgi:hypothetical protein